MYYPETGTFKIDGQTFKNFEGDFEEVELLIKSYLQSIGDSLPDENDGYWGLPDDDNIVVDSDGRIGILSNSQLFTVGGR